MLKKIFFALFVGLIAVFFSMRDDQWIKDYVGNHFKRVFEKTFNCTVACDVVSIDFLHPCIVLNNVKVSSAPDSHEKWQWRCKELSSECTWRSLLLYRMIDLSVSVNQLCVTSDITGVKPDIFPHVKKIIKGMPRGLPVHLQLVEIRNATCTASNTQKTLSFSCSFDSWSKRVDGVLCSRMEIKSSCARMYERLCWDTLSGVITWDKRTDGFHVVTDCTCDIPQLAQLGTACRVKGKLQGQRGYFFVESKDKTLSINPVTVSIIDDKIIVACSAQFPFSYLSHLVANDAIKIGSSGTCSLKTIANLTDLSRGLNGHLDIKNVQFGRGLSDASCKIYFSRRGRKWKGGAQVHLMPTVEINGAWHWDEDTNKGSLEATNNLLIEIPGTRYWNMRPHECNVKISFDKQHGISGKYSGIVRNAKLDRQVALAGHIKEQNKKLCIEGKVGDTAYQVRYKLEPHVCFEQFSLKNKDSLSLTSIKRDGNTIKGEIEFPLIRSVVKGLLQYDVQGEGRFVVSACLEGQCLTGNITLVDGTIRVPETYNFMNEFCATFALDYLNKKAVVKDVVCTLHKGTISCKRAVAYFDERLVPSFVHAPFKMNSCLLNVQRDLFAVVSGSLLVTRSKKSCARIYARLILERSQLKENLFSQGFQKNLFTITNEAFNSNDVRIDCDVTIGTRDPIRVKTSFLETAANVNISVSNTIKDPHVEGSINLTGGKLLFPYKPLYIKKGRITFIKGQLNDPSIELIAKNKIKKNTVTMRVVGSLQHPDISLDSSPPLTEQQIISLLFAGSEENSLNVVVPALVIQNVRSLLFDSDSLGRSITRFFYPFKHVRLIPSLSDQTGRGGLRASLEIEIKNRWRALIQKNFSLSEDTRFEFGYLFSDDVNVRVFRDERRDVGGELEVRLKF